MKDFAKKYWILLVIVVCIPVVITLCNDSKKMSTMLDGAVVTDKTGKSYMLQSDTIGSSYKVYEFDVARMKMVR